jgi:hypothetical protein
MHYKDKSSSKKRQILGPTLARSKRKEKKRKELHKFRIKMGFVAKIMQSCK